MWIRNVFKGLSSTYRTPNRNFKTQLCLNIAGKIKRPLLFISVKPIHSLSCCLKSNEPRMIYCQIVLNRMRSHGKKYKCSFYSTMTSQRKFSKEAWLLVLLGVTGGVVYGLNKKYESDQFDRKMDEIDQIIKKAQALDVQQKNMETKLYKDVLQIVKTQIDSEQSQKRMTLLTTKFVFIIDQLANLMHGLGKLSEAEDYYKQTLQALLAHGTKKDDDSVIEISLKLASLYAEQKKHELAENGFSWCVENARNKVDRTKNLNTNSAALLGICLESFGKYSLSRNQSSKAISLFSEASEISKSIYGEHHPQVVLLLNNLGVAYFEAGNMDSSKNCFNQAINLSENKNYEDLWSFHLNLANLLTFTGDNEEAKKEYKQSIQLCPSEIIRNDIKEKLLKLS